MSLIPLGNLLKVGAAGVQGYGEDKADAIKAALQALQEQRAADKAALDQALGKKALAKIESGEPGYGDYAAGNAMKLIPGDVAKTVALAGPEANAAATKARALIGPTVEQTRALIPPKTEEATALIPSHAAGAAADAAAVAPVARETHRVNRETDLATEPKKIIGGLAPDGTPKFGRVSTESGPAEPITGITPKPTTGGSGGSLLPADRTRMYAQAQVDDAEMTRIENRVLAKELDFGTAAGLASAAAGAHGSALSDAVSVLGNKAVGMLDPDIQVYNTANESYGRIMGNLQSKRYTDNQARIEKKIGGMTGNDLVEAINYKRELRKASLDDVAHTPPPGASATATASPPSVRPPADTTAGHVAVGDADFARAWKAGMRSDADITAWVVAHPPS